MPAAEMKRRILFEVVPADAEVNFDECIKTVEGLSLPGTQWVGKSGVEPHVFGLSKLVMTCDFADESVEVDKMIELIEALSTDDLDYSATVANVDFVEVTKPKAKKEEKVEEKVEEEEAPAKPAKAAPQMKRRITLEVVPADAEADFPDCIKKIEAISLPGVAWFGKAAVEPHVFGLSKIIITADMSDEAVQTEDLIEEIEKLTTEDLDYSATVANVDFVEIIQPKAKKPEETVESLKAQLAAKDEEIAALKAEVEQLKAGGAKGGKKDKKGGDKKDFPKKEPKEELPAGLDKKMAAKCDQDGSSKAKELKKMADEYGNMYYAAGVSSPEGHLLGLEHCLKAANKAAPELGKLFASEGPQALAVGCYIPEGAPFTIKEWLDAAFAPIGGVEVGEVTEKETYTLVHVPMSVEKGRFPIKDKDEVIGDGFQYLRTKGLIVEDEDDDEPDLDILDAC